MNANYLYLSNKHLKFGSQGCFGRMAAEGTANDSSLQQNFLQFHSTVPKLKMKSQLSLVIALKSNSGSNHVARHLHKKCSHPVVLNSAPKTETKSFGASPILSSPHSFMIPKNCWVTNIQQSIRAAAVSA